MVSLILFIYQMLPWRFLWRTNKNQILILKSAIQLALLHDVLEDTALSFKALRRLILECSCNGCFGLTKDSTLDKKDQMDDSLNRILDLGREVAIVKLCDRITNLQRPPKKWDNAKIKKYHLQAIKIAERLQGKNEYLDKRIQEKILNYSTYF